jgi:hypothetical protein
MTVPLNFLTEAQEAFAKDDRPHLVLQSLEVPGMAWEDAGKALIQSYLDRLPPAPSVDRLVLFTGHRIDSADRDSPRFPSEDEPVARAAITEMLSHEQEQGHVTGMAGGANGGDILFLESCRELGIPFRMLLALPEDQFIAKSVAGPAGNWVERFHSLAKEASPGVLAKSKELPAWLEAKSDYNIWARNNLWMISSALALEPSHFVLAALWDGQLGDGAGGTENMVQVAQQHGAVFIHLDTRELFRSSGAIRSARPSPDPA